MFQVVVAIAIRLLRSSRLAALLPVIPAILGRGVDGRLAIHPPRAVSLAVVPAMFSLSRADGNNPDLVPETVSTVARG